jgi:DNA-binding NarL/FixJ family response regulator
MNEPPVTTDTVLVVDDSPSAVALIVDAFEDAGMTVLVSLSGANALALVERITPDIVLMDAIMPGMDGFETCRQLKRRPELEHVPVIFMTGLSETEHLIQAFAAGGVDYVTKPVVPGELIARARVHLANGRLTRSARTALDATGRFLMAVDPEGRMLWCTPHVRRLLGQSLDEPDSEVYRLPPEARLWLAECEGSAACGAREPFALRDPRGGAARRVMYIGRVAANEHLLRLVESDASNAARLLKERLALTPREAEVLLWPAQAKSTREIATILDLSPRTVNKHLEQIYTKLGVENRTAAAAIAARAMETP